MRNILLPLLLPAIVALVVLLALGTPGSVLAAAMVTMAGFVMALIASRDSVRRQLQVLTRTTRTRLEAPPAVRSPEEEDTLDEVSALERAIQLLHIQLTARNAQLTQEARTLTAVLKL
jgi:two-component system phosphate regulon sensor histidine kinase PhoR